MISIPEGQQLRVEVKEGKVALNILAPDGKPIDENAVNAQFWEAPAPLPPGKYAIDVVAPEETDFTIDIKLPKPLG